MSTLNDDGREYFDQTPVEFPIKFERPTPLHIRIRQQILQLQNDMRASTEYDTPEEADDFDMDENSDMWNSPYEGDFDHINDEKFKPESEPETKPESEPETKPESKA